MKFSVIEKMGRFQVPLESRADIAATVGNIIAQFAAIEDHLPKLLSATTSMTEDEAAAILSVFRAFSNKIDVLEAVAKRHGPDRWEGVILSHFKGRLNEANAIRNKYSHASYAAGPNGDITLFPYSADKNRNSKPELLSIGIAERDFSKIVQINTECTFLLGFAEVPKGLHAKLPPPNRG